MCSVSAQFKSLNLIGKQTCNKVLYIMELLLYLLCNQLVLIKTKKVSWKIY